MAYFEHVRVGISAISACVPRNRYNNLKDNQFFSSDDAAAIVDKIGIKERRVAAKDLCATDLAYRAVRRLLTDTEVNEHSIDALILVTQTPDYRMPASAILLQSRLGLGKHCAAFDINLGCSGFVYGLNLAYSLAVQPLINKILLINAETRTKVYSFKDRKTGFLFGDAATAVLIEKGDSFTKSCFKLDSDGEKADYIIITSGGYRNPSNTGSFIEREHEDGSVRSDEQAFMNGQGVFEFVIGEVPKHVRSVLKMASVEQDSVDYFVFHQANRFMNEHLLKKLKLDPQKTPNNLDRFGNTSSVSVPLTIVTELKGKLKGHKTLLISGFGVGLSLGTALINVNSPMICDLEEI